MTLNANALTTLVNAKSHLGITSGDTTQDARLAIFINGASSFIEDYCDRKLLYQEITEIQHGRRSNIALCHEWPVKAITEVWIDQSHLFTDVSNKLAATEYSIGDDELSVVLFHRSFIMGYNNIKLIYHSGYAPGDSELAQLELACLWLVEWYYLHRQRGDMGRTSKSKGDESVGIMGDVPPMIKSALDSFKRIDIPGSNAPVFNL